MPKFFCKVDPILNIAGFDAGYLFARNNPQLKAGAVGVANGILTALKGGSTNEALNAMLQAAIAEWASKLNDPLIQMNVLAIASMLNINLELPSTSFSNEQIEAILQGFLNGAAAVK